MNAGQVMAAVRQHGWRVFTRPFELNIVGLRSVNTRANSFDDLICAVYHDRTGKAVGHFFPATTDPGTYWLRQPMNPQGTAILSQGQYVGAYSLGLHRGKYLALVQKGQVTVIRDYDRDAVLDFHNGTKATGHFGINIHHASSNGTTKVVDKYSAGCQVLANIDDYDTFISLCKRHRELYGNKFTYTLIDARAVGRNARRRMVVSVLAFTIAALSATMVAYHLGGQNPQLAKATGAQKRRRK